MTKNDLAAIYELPSSHAKGDQLSVDEMVASGILSGKELALFREKQPEMNAAFQPQVDPQPNDELRK